MKRQASSPLLDRLASLSDPLRLRLLRIAEQHELSVGEIAKVAQLPQSTVSRHLKTLTDAGWLSRRQEGTATYFSLVPDDLSSEARALWSAVRDQAATREELAEDVRRLRAVLSERRTDSQAFFGKNAGEWDALRNDLFGGGFTGVALLSLLRKDWVVADVGCGTGNAAELVAPFVERVYAIDRSGPMLSAAKQRLSGQSNVEFLEAALEAIPLAARSIDAAMCVLVLHHLENPVAALSGLQRLMRTERGGGTVLIVDMLSHDRDEYRRLMGHKHLGFSRDEMLRIMREAGLDDLVYRELPGEPDAKGPGLFAATGRVSNE